MQVDPDTLSAATAGDGRALSEVVEVLQQPLYNLCLRVLGTHADAEDASQEALLRVVTHLGTFRGESRFSTWVWSIATRVALEVRRKRGRQPLSVEGFRADLSEGRDDEAIERAEDAILVQQVKLGCGRAMLQVLDDDLRVAYVLGEILEVPGPEAARAVGISPAAFRKRLSRARERVNATLRGTCGVVDPDAACRCHRRVGRARALGRLEGPDRAGRVDVPALRRQVSALSELARSRAFYRADPSVSPPGSLLSRVHEALGLPAP
jgi:RNA polymerase sigma factor (sigma-70 family)